MTVVADKTWSVGEVVTAANLNTYLRDNLSNLQAAKIDMKTGEYTGDDTVSQAITGVGFTPMFVSIRIATADESSWQLFETTTELVDDDAEGLSWFLSSAAMTAQDNDIISLDADGFTVDDGGANGHPNTNGQKYYYIAFGIAS